MARSINDKTEPKGRGHNSAALLTQEDQAALQLNYSLKVRAQRAKADEAKAAYDVQRNDLNGIFALVKGDLKISRKDFESDLALQAAE